MYVSTRLKWTNGRGCWRKGRRNCGQGWGQKEEGPDAKQDHYGQGRHAGVRPRPSVGFPLVRRRGPYVRYVSFTFYLPRNETASLRTAFAECMPPFPERTARASKDHSGTSAHETTGRRRRHKWREPVFRIGSIVKWLCPVSPGRTVETEQTRIADRLKCFQRDWTSLPPALVAHLERPGLLLEAGCGTILVELVARQILGPRGDDRLVGAPAQ
jgi:hypothetical protein